MILTQKIAGKFKLSLWEFIRFQVIMYCSINSISFSESTIDTISLLSLLGKVRIIDFCKRLSETKLSVGARIKKTSGKSKEFPFIFNSEQSARNALNCLTQQGLIIKDKHFIEVNPTMNLTTEPLTILNYQIVGLDTTQS